jgi:hypothetical protein
MNRVAHPPVNKSLFRNNVLQVVGLFVASWCVVMKLPRFRAKIPWLSAIMGPVNCGAATPIYSGTRMNRPTL